MGILLDRGGVVSSSIIISDRTPYISEITGTALIDALSHITVSGFNFIPSSQIICSAGTISNIQISPETIVFDIIASTPGSYSIEIKNNTLSSNDWNSPYQPILIARNPLNLTDGWLDFRTVDGSTLGSVQSHNNQSLSTKTLANSGFSLNSTRGLIFDGTGQSESYNNYIQFNSFIFPFSDCKYQIVFYFDTLRGSTTNPYRIRAGIGVANNSNTLASGIDFSNNIVNFSVRYVLPYVFTPSLTMGTANGNILNNNTYFLKYIFDFTSNIIEIHKLIDGSNLEYLNKIEEFPINFLNRTTNTSILPLFQYTNPSSLSSVIAMRID